MKPAIYLNQGFITSYKGLAYSMDGHTVFHAYSSLPAVIPSGIALDCYFQYLSHEEMETYGFEQHIRSIDGHTRLVIFLDRSGGPQGAKGFFYEDEKITACIVHFLPPVTELYSRNHGLIESAVLENKTVAIIGLGSGGSMVAAELAKAGVGKFLLFDFDILELSNISRHICGLNDLGRYKTFAVRDHLLQKNPAARITTYEVNINDNLEDFRNMTAGADLIIGASDSNASRFNVNQTALAHQTVALFGRAITRAAGGDVLRVRPFEGPCLNCLFTSGLINQEQEISQLRQVRSEMPAYVSDNEAAAMIQVGLSSDIAPIANMVVKLALVELSKGTASGISSLEEDLIADYYLWANRRDLIYAQWPKMEYSFNKQSILRWYGARAARDKDCVVCGERHLDTDNIFV